MSQIPFQTHSWGIIPKTEHISHTGTSFWQTLKFEWIQICLVEYSTNYIAGRWCIKKYIVYSLEGQFKSQVDDSIHMLSKSMSYIVSDGRSSHRSSSGDGVKLVIIDGDFLH